ncbi:carbon monoxide dehydrogenase [Streptomyces sp. V2]|uniref:SRPBCC family protein n=1 Tax=Streptomyces niveiscabiei TaxID=164115 RepID=A0ABW9I4S4_9ACTN|nr:SRPBCC domain-containing protein [Streptomyces sp. V2]PWG10250.1 carbon monoxide dehydrogenase [Streptomyces sp. V2]
MEQEVFVPVPAERLRAALADPAQVARAVPGLQQDAGTPPVAGRLKIRVGSHTITYRGNAQVSPGADGTYTVRADAAEARGAGKVHLALTLALAETATGTTLRFTGTARADGRIAELPPETVAAAVARLVNRFGGNLGTTGTGPDTRAAEQNREAGQGSETERGSDGGQGSETRQGLGAERSPGVEQSGEAERDLGTGQDPEASRNPEAERDSGAERDLGAVHDAEPERSTPPKQSADSKPSPDPDPTPDLNPELPFPPTVFETEIPSSALDPLASLNPADPPAEAAHARRTMIGRSAEEVDHAPPRGRYAPVPAPQSFTPASTLRWAAPAAALAVVSAVVVGRALRRRR